MQDRPAISIKNLTKRYAPNKGEGEGKLALKGVSFDVPQGGVRAKFTVSLRAPLLPDPALAADRRRDVLVTGAHPLLE